MKPLVMMENVTVATTAVAKKRSARSTSEKIGNIGRHLVEIVTVVVIGGTNIPNMIDEKQGAKRGMNGATQVHGAVGVVAVAIA